MKVKLTILLLILSQFARGQSSILDSLTRKEKRNYVNISFKARRVPSAISTNISLLADHLTRNAKSDLDKVRAFYVWIASNVSYDFKSFESGAYPSQVPDVVIARRTALCQGYADLFHALCNEVGIKSHVISGYSKGYGYSPNKEFETSDHAWNSVKIEDEWFLLDATWGSAPNDVEPYNDKYFLTLPKNFVVEHLPLDPIWQFLDPPVPVEVFEDSEQQIIDFIQTDNGGFNYKDSLAKWEQTGRSQAAIDSHKRSISFNPRNKRAVYRLGTELLFKALDLMDMIHHVNYSTFETEVSKMQEEMFSLLDEAAFHFTNIPETHPDFEDASDLAEEVTFQKGVFHYEAGQRIYDIFLEMDRDTFFKNLDEGVQQIDKYYGLATYYFNLVNIKSRYYEDAREYVDDYIRGQNPLVPRN